MAGLEPSEATTDDYHMGEGPEALVRWFQFEEEAFAGHQCRGSGLKVSIPGRFALLKVGLVVDTVMSLASIKSFVSRVAGDGALRDKLHAAAGVDDIVAIAAAHGHEIDKTVLLREHAKVLATAQDHELAGINSWGDALMHCFGATEND